MFDVWPFKNRRAEERLVVEGIDAFVDGFPCEIIDLSASAVRVVRPDLAPLVPEKIVLTLRSQADAPPLDISVRASLIRENYEDMVIKYERPMAGWQDWIRQYDTFAHLGFEGAAG